MKKESMGHEGHMKGKGGEGMGHMKSSFGKMKATAKSMGKGKIDGPAHCKK